MTVAIEPEIEYFTSKSEDFWVCVCDNHPGELGHALARADGTPDDDDPDYLTHQTYTCLGCGRFGRATERDPVTGQIPVRGRVTEELLVRCDLGDDPISAVVKNVINAVAEAHRALRMERERLQGRLFTPEVSDMRSKQALAYEVLTHRRHALITELKATGELLKQLRRIA